MARTDIIGLRDLERSFRQLGRVPQTVATQAARAGASVARSAAKKNAPVDTGDLKKGIIMKRERKTKQGKAVYDIMMDPAMNDVFVKESKEGKRSYYPASQEYGFLTADGGYVPGYRYLRRSIDDNKTMIEKKTLEKAGKAVEKILRGR
ncbi:HK97 gp10 family phage protein [Cohnella cholangitidis]|uniref:HK97 gp10 family phage protein n=1 Tax=Cohnella cholangitidis TaxID=2598458 RepID=A0A7G5C5I2_9BACL|nr:HK97 gp10 family phage protein [Cohnella cholangitidis]QMV44466.1 HK97 gp10 family phage protein [Cohnella cholangitidis]